MKINEICISTYNAETNFFNVLHQTSPWWRDGKVAVLMPTVWFRVHHDITIKVEKRIEYWWFRKFVLARYWFVLYSSPWWHADPHATAAFNLHMHRKHIPIGIRFSMISKEINHALKQYNKMLAGKTSIQIILYITYFYIQILCLIKLRIFVLHNW